MTDLGGGRVRLGKELERSSQSWNRGTYALPI